MQAQRNPDEFEHDEPDEAPRTGGLTWDEIAQELGITRRQAQCICERALMKLRRRMLAAGIDETMLHTTERDLPVVVFAALYECDVPLVEIAIADDDDDDTTPPPTP